MCHLAFVVLIHFKQTVESGKDGIVLLGLLRRLCQQLEGSLRRHNNIRNDARPSWLCLRTQQPCLKPQTCSIAQVMNGAAACACLHNGEKTQTAIP